MYHQHLDERRGKQVKVKRGQEPGSIHHFTYKIRPTQRFCHMVLSTHLPCTASRQGED